LFLPGLVQWIPGHFELGAFLLLRQEKGARTGHFQGDSEAG
jgi:hypothetical protein